jgi:hypothetical protein
LRLSQDARGLIGDRMVHDALRRRDRIGSTHQDVWERAIQARQGPAPLVPDATFEVVTIGQVEELMFANEQVTDSAEGLNKFATTKVRMLVSRFTGKL